MDLTVNIGKLRLKNPVMTASGTFGYGDEFAEYFDVSRLGAIVVKGLSLKPKQGNPPPRIVETPSGMLNAIGLQNIGIDEFISRKLPFLRKQDTAVIVNFFGDSIDEYVQAAEKLSSHEGIHALEMNISCPNKEAGWSVFGTDPNVTSNVVSAVRKATTLPLIVKLSPNVTDIAYMAKVAEDAGADALSLINTLVGMAIDIRTRRPKLANITGGLSGPAIKPVAVRMVWQCSKAVKIPIIGMGGIISAEDAIEFLIAGASAIAVGTGNFVTPLASMNVLEGIEKYMSDMGIDKVSDLTGSLR
ncbi:MAG: dihydroorotate dehydrogenase [Thermodesulfovibrionia bacterium]|nr:dihydroorotate dehydrogenase [Thermodesulfovibrionia bacterium]